MSPSGILIAVEAAPGTTVDDHLKHLQAWLEQGGYSVKLVRFPQADSPSNRLFRQERSTAYSEALFYALDHYEQATVIRAALDQGEIVLVSGYAGANMASRGASFGNPEERRGFFIWADNLTFQILNVPRPTKTFVLRASTDKLDANDQHVSQVYNDLCQLFPQDFSWVDGVRGGQVIEDEAIDNLLWELIKPLLPVQTESSEKPTPTTVDYLAMVKHDETGNYRYHVPDTLDNATKRQYRAIMDQIFDYYRDIITHLSAHRDNPEWINTARLVLPLAAMPPEEPTPPAPELAKLAEDNLSDNHADTTETVSLTNVWPRNELDVVPVVLYEHSNLPLETIKAEVAQWPIDRKQAALTTYLQQAEPTALQYQWELLTDRATLMDLRAVVPQAVVREQAATPRYGYDMPELVELADVSDQFEACFDLSLQLHSQLQSSGYQEEMFITTLLGHRSRYTVQLTAGQLQKLQTSSNNPVIRQLVATLAATHPSVCEWLSR